MASALVRGVQEENVMDFIWGVRDTEEAANGGQDMTMMTKGNIFQMIQLLIIPVQQAATERILLACMIMI